MNDLTSAPAPEDLGYFYDTIHGRIALEELPAEFRPALRSALSSKTLARLKRISQLGHTSVSFFSATHTRFSHAIGTMLVMNDLFHHVCNQHGLDKAVFEEVNQFFPDVASHFADVRVKVHCHLLLAALYQDTGELPFQKVTSLHFVPAEGEVNFVADALRNATPSQWTGKQVLSVCCLLNDFEADGLKAGFVGFDREFLAYLITGDGVPAGAMAIGALLQMVDGVVDADRLDYVYRDASVTIGSLSRPSTILESIVRYEPGRVIVNDPRPVTDFLSTRMRLWTFVYSSADVRFRQALLKTVLDGRWESEKTEAAFGKEGIELDPELSHKKFLTIDDVSLMDRIEKLDSSIFVKPYRSRAIDLLLRGTLDYECRVLERGDVDATAAPTQKRDLPAEMFFDLLSDHGHHQLYRPGSILVQQGLTSKISNAMPLEESAGAFSPLFTGENSAMLVRNGYYVFLPREKRGTQWRDVAQAMDDKALFPLINVENARRVIPRADTRNTVGFKGRLVVVSFSSRDFPIVVRVVRELHRRKQHYRLFLRSWDGIGETPAANSKDLIAGADAVLVVASKDYLERATDGRTYIAMEVAAMHDRAAEISIVPLAVDRRSELEKVKNWDWGQMNESWRGTTPWLSEDLPLRYASEETLRVQIAEALDTIERRKKV